MSELETQKDRNQRPGIWDRSPAGRLISQIFSFELVVLSALLTLLTLVPFALKNPYALLRDPDIWWHLANARHLFASGFIHIEPYAFSVAGKPWINSEWLAEVPYWLGFSYFGLRGLLVVNIIAAELNVIGIYLLARQRTGHLWSSLIAASICLPLLAMHFGPRTVLWGYVCLILELAILQAWKQGHRRLLWLMPLLFCLWINLHGSWAMGFFLFLLFAALSHISVSFGDFYSERLPLSQLRQIWIVAALSAAALFVNPYGWKLIWYPADLMFHQKLNVAIVQEWQPLRLNSLAGEIVVIIALFILLTNGIRHRRWGLFEVFLVAFGTYAAIDHSRFSCLLAIFAIPSIAFELHRVWLPGKNPNDRRPLLNAAITIAFWAISIMLLPSAAHMEKSYNQKFPTRLAARIQPEWRVMNSINLGGWLALHHKPDFIDTRYDTFESHEVLKNYLDAMNVQNTLSVLNQYRIDHVLFEQNSPLVYLLLHTGGWKQIGAENGYVLLARTSP